MDRRNFLRGIVGAGAAVAAKQVAPPELVELKCKGCGGILDQIGDIFECTSCGSRYTLAGVVVQREEDGAPKRVMEGLHCLCDSTGEPVWSATSAALIVYQDWPFGRPRSGPDSVRW